ncbi:major facilitator superfamily domain-containing protein 10 [Penicillium atrosanguineum]|nr:major facilitator superfamily domain-containing protein 10 [Penicillium atrosanguineum]
MAKNGKNSRLSPSRASTTVKSTPASASQRRRILTTLTISLLLDLISFTLILPLFPSVLGYYHAKETSPTSTLNRVFHYLNVYKNWFAKPIDSSYDIVLLGGAFGSLFSLLQAVASPVIGRLSDQHGRRKALLCSLAGNILSVGLWVGATDFRVFIASRVVGGLSEGNVQIANSIITDISDEKQRGSAMALVGACFSLAFICGPVLGATLANIPTTASNKFAMAAGVSLFLIALETIYVYFSLPETHPRLSRFHDPGPPAATLVDKDKSRPRVPTVVNGDASKASVNGDKSSSNAPRNRDIKVRMRNESALKLVHLFFLLPFSGLEFSLPFLTATLYADQASAMGPSASQTSTLSPSALNGRLLSLMGLIASLLQGTIVRRLPPIVNIRLGVVACTISFFLHARVDSMSGVYVAGIFLAVTSATVVTSINSLGSLGAPEGERGIILGRLRSWGQVGRAVGPFLFCSLFWWAGREVAYMTGGVMMIGVVGAVFTVLK